MRPIAYSLVLLAPLAACESSVDLCNGTQGCIAIPSGSSADKIADAFALVADNGSIVFGKGSFDLTTTLNLSAAGVTMRGQGIDTTTLDFSNQAAGEDGVLVTGDHFTIQDLTVLNSKGNGIKVSGTADKLLEGATFQRVAGKWTASASAQNGKYAIYPVLVNDVLMENCVAQGSSDAGIYVGQSTNIIVRNNKAQGNVAGLEIENSIGADVYMNDVEGNAGGLLVFGLPDLIQNTSKVRVFDNTAKANNLTNFADAGSIVSNVPAGTGALIMAASDVEFFGNTIETNQAVGLAIVSYCVVDSTYCSDSANASAVLDPYPRNIYAHDNTITGNGTAPALGLYTASGTLSPLSGVIANTYGAAVPQLIYDGIFAPPKGQDPTTWMPSSTTNPMGICYSNNASADFSNFDANNYDSSTMKFPNATTTANEDISTFTCTPSLGLTPIQIPGVTGSST